MEALLSTWLPPTVIVAIIAAIIIWTNYRTNKRSGAFRSEVQLEHEKFRKQIHRQLDELRSQIHHGDGALLAEAKTINESLTAHITDRTLHKS